jgi:hypothetical protein
VHKRQRIHAMKNESPKGTGVFRDNRIVVARIGIGDTAAARSHPVQPVFVKRFKKNKKGARARYLLRINQLLAAAARDRLSKVDGPNYALMSAPDSIADAFFGEAGFRRTG